MRTKVSKTRRLAIMTMTHLSKRSQRLSLKTRKPKMTVMKRIPKQLIQVMNRTYKRTTKICWNWSQMQMIRMPMQMTMLMTIGRMMRLMLSLKNRMMKNRKRMTNQSNRPSKKRLPRSRTSSQEILIFNQMVRNTSESTHRNLMKTLQINLCTTSLENTLWSRRMIVGNHLANS